MVPTHSGVVWTALLLFLLCISAFHGLMIFWDTPSQNKSVRSGSFLVRLIVVSLLALGCYALAQALILDSAAVCAAVVGTAATATTTTEPVAVLTVTATEVHPPLLPLLPDPDPYNDGLGALVSDFSSSTSDFSSSASDYSSTSSSGSSWQPREDASFWMMQRQMMR